MKKVIFICAAILVGCAKPSTEKQFHKQLQGSWTKTEAKFTHMEVWEAYPSTESDVQITETHVSDPWNAEYEVLNKEHIYLKGETIKVEILKKDKMMWTSNGDSLRFERVN